jgi:hypothetical protein
MKGLNSEGTPKVIQFSAHYTDCTDYNGIAIGSANVPHSSWIKHENTSAWLTILYDTILGLTFNSAGYRTSSFEGLTTGALYSPPSPYAGAGVGTAPV